jgi:hypothetical protein
MYFITMGFDRRGEWVRLPQAEQQRREFLPLGAPEIRNLLGRHWAWSSRKRHWTRKQLR